MTTHIRHPIAFTACLLAAALVLSHAALLGGVVVCVGADGHVDVEFALEGCCSLEAGQGEAVAVDQMRPTPTCGNCVDLELRVVSWKTGHSQPGSVTLQGEGRVVRLCAQAGFSGFSSIQTDQHWRTLESVSTVVLLT